MTTELPPFKLERYFALYEFKAPYILSASDCESLRLSEVLSHADKETAEMWNSLSLGYTESAGHPALREEIAGIYQILKPDDTLVLAPEEGIFIAMQTLLQPGDEVISISPAYQSLYAVAASMGCRVKKWPVQKDSHGWYLDLDELKRSLTDHTRLLVINFPHNPTGCLPERPILDAILNLAQEHGTYVFSDEMYRLLEYDLESRLPSVCDQYDRGISLSGMSKTFALPGLRIGWLASRAPGMIQRCMSFKDYTTICSSAPSEILALIGLRARDAIVARNLEIIRRNLDLAGAFFARNADLFRWLQPQAGSVSFPEWIGTGSAESFCQGLLEGEGVMLVPAGLFDFPGEHFRLGLGRRNFHEGLERVEYGIMKRYS
jgi:aspartate/methionine/tyrosine aminotransferase